MAGQLTLTLDRESRPPPAHARASIGAVTPLPVDAAEPAGAAPVWVRRVTTAAVLAVAVVAAVASYEHMRALAAVAGEGWRSWLLPVSVDGLAVAASMTMLVRRRAGKRAGVLPWVALVLGLGHRWRRMWRRRTRRWWAGWWRRGRQSGCCCPTNFSCNNTVTVLGVILASRPSVPVLSNPSMEATPDERHDDDRPGSRASGGGGE